MNRNFLLPNKWKKWGFILLTIGLTLAIIRAYDHYFYIDVPTLGYWYSWDSSTDGGSVQYINHHFGIDERDVTNTLAIISIISGLLISFFSREKVEDELFSKMRLDALAWAVIINCAIILIADFTLWSLNFLGVIQFNLASILIVAILRFNYLKMRLNKYGLSTINKKEKYLIPYWLVYVGYALFLIAIGMHINEYISEDNCEILFPNKFDLVWNNAIELMTLSYNGQNLHPADSQNIYSTLNILIGIVGLLLISFSREKFEDEYISEIRLNALSFAVISHYIVISFATVLIWGEAYLDVMLYAMFTPMIFFIIRFNYLKYKMRKSLAIDLLEGEAS